MTDVQDDGILESGKITVLVANRDLLMPLCDHIKKWLLDNVPAEIRMRVNWSITHEFTVMDVRDRR